jgi:hypothetical protein
MGTLSLKLQTPIGVTIIGGVCSLKFAFYATHHYAMHMHYYATHMQYYATHHSALCNTSLCIMQHIILHYATHHYAMHMHYYATPFPMHLPIGGVCSLKFALYATHHYANSYWCFIIYWWIVCEHIW